MDWATGGVSLARGSATHAATFTVSRGVIAETALCFPGTISMPNKETPVRLPDCACLSFCFECGHEMTRLHISRGPRGLVRTALTCAVVRTARRLLLTCCRSGGLYGSGSNCTWPSYLALVRAPPPPLARGPSDRCEQDSGCHQRHSRRAHCVCTLDTLATRDPGSARRMSRHSARHMSPLIAG